VKKSVLLTGNDQVRAVSAGPDILDQLCPCAVPSLFRALASYASSAVKSGDQKFGELIGSRAVSAGPDILDSFVPTSVPFSRSLPRASSAVKKRRPEIR
jgi:hypothetical protein